MTFRHWCYIFKVIIIYILKEMDIFRCSYCSKVTISIEGNRCSHCDYNETRESSIPKNPAVIEVRTTATTDNFLHMQNIFAGTDCSILPQVTDICIDGQNIESNINISETDQDYNAPSKISDSIASNRGSVCSVDDCLAMPGPSGLRENRNTSNLCGEAFQSFTCGVCKVAIAEHATEGNNFKCCNCWYTNCKEVDLQIHSYTHVPKTTCDICEQEHAVGNSHNSRHRCPIFECPLTFHCRTQLYEHFLVHREYFRKNCWVCSRTFIEHITENDSSYACCVCGFQSNQLSSLENHNRLHPPRFYCKLCEEEYSAEEKRLHGSEFTCFECPEEFECQTQVEAHYEDKHKNYSENCKICKRSINEHLIGPAVLKDYQCCKNECLQTFLGRRSLQDHLYSHTGLRVFKCKNCGRRFNQRNCLGGHSIHCKDLPFKCELCEIRFHSSDILRAHHLVNHRQA